MKKRTEYLLRVKGVPFRCPCGCNVFQKDDWSTLGASLAQVGLLTESLYVCNACRARYRGQAQEQPSSSD